MLTTTPEIVILNKNCIALFETRFTLLHMYIFLFSMRSVLRKNPKHMVSEMHIYSFTVVKVFNNGITILRAISNMVVANAGTGKNK